MLAGIRLHLSFMHEQNCFAVVNTVYSFNSGESECVKVLAGDKTLYLWVVFNRSVPEGTICLNAYLARIYELPLNTEILVCSSSKFRNLESITIAGNGEDDETLLELNHIQLQSLFLKQVRLLVANQKAVVWVSPSLPVVFTPHQSGILVNHSEVHIQTRIMTPQIPFQSMPQVEEKKINSLNTMKGLVQPFHSLPRMALRALPIDGDGKKDLIHPYTVFMHEDLVDEKFRNAPFIVALMKSLPSKILEKDSGSFIWRHELCVEVVPVNSVVYRSLCKEVYSQYIPTILIPKSLNIIINVESGTMLMLTLIDHKSLKQPQQIEVITYLKIASTTETLYGLIEKFKNLVIQNTYSGKVFLVNHDMLKLNKILTPGYIKFRLTPSSVTYTTLTEETFRNCTISAQILDPVELMYQHPALTVSNNNEYMSYCRAIKPFELLLESIISHVLFDIQREARFSDCLDIKSNVLITGLTGSGKSTICHLVEKEISVYSHIMQCRQLRGRKDILSEFPRALSVCLDRKPALLILDDIDDMMPSMEGLSPAEIASYDTIAIDIKRALLSTTGVSVVMTARSVNSMHPVFRLGRGQPLYTQLFAIPELGQDDRVQLFQHLVNPSIRQKFEIDVDDVIRLSMDTKGCNMSQIMVYFRTKVFDAVVKKSSNPIGPKPRLVEDVTKDIKKVTAFDIWGPIGGLQNVKEKLNECLFWPILYPALYPSHSCGILLYGPPGTGKSLVGSCLARMHNMRMITVKGPELLSKYIGQSEAAVREVFERAEMNHPCILFFDEFDSLAPKRGHDSTGVTDRVVNQLLARLDGAEGGARGPVLAATSRPDLLDPALLRAGRLATHLCTDLPGVDGRYEVLRTLAKDFNLKRSVNLRDYAEQTEGFSPADLKSLLVTAQMGRVDMECLEKGLGSAIPSADSLVIDTGDLDGALFTTKPSLNAQQRRFYDIIYRRFRGELPSQNEMRSLEQRMRVTLA